MWKALLIVLPLGGCMTVEDRRVLDDYMLRTYSRADVDALNATAQCKALARNLVQISRCDVRR